MTFDVTDGTETVSGTVNTVNNDFHPTSPRDTQADGLTRVLTIQADIVPNTTYRLKIAVGDAGDTALDSWVLLRAGSFTAVCPLIPSCPTCGGGGGQ